MENPQNINLTQIKAHLVHVKPSILLYTRGLMCAWMNQAWVSDANTYTLQHYGIIVIYSTLASYPDPFALTAWEKKRAWYPLFWWRHVLVQFSVKCLRGIVCGALAQRKYPQSTSLPCSFPRGWRETFLDALASFYLCHLSKATIIHLSVSESWIYREQATQI